MNELGKNYLDWLLEGRMRNVFKKLKSNVSKIMNEDGWCETHDITKIRKELDIALRKVDQIKSTMVELDEMVENGYIGEVTRQDILNDNPYGRNKK